jgi:hypothetical protein
MQSVSCAPKKGPAKSVNYFRQVLSRPDLSSTAKVLFTLLCDAAMAARSNTIAVPASEIAPDLGVAPDRVSVLAAELRAAGIISTRQPGRKPLEYTILVDISSLDPYYLICGPYAELFTWIVENRDPSDSGPVKTEVQSDVALPPDPHPAREYYIAPPPPPEITAIEADELVVVQKLTQHGITAAIAP